MIVFIAYCIEFSAKVHLNISESLLGTCLGRESKPQGLSEITKGLENMAFWSTGDKETKPATGGTQSNEVIDGLKGDGDGDCKSVEEDNRLSVEKRTLV